MPCDPNYLTISTRPLRAADLDDVLAIQQASPEASYWNRAAYDDVVAGNGMTKCHVAVVGSISGNSGTRQTIGFACFRTVAGQAELLNLAVSPGYRRLRIGVRLLDEIVRETSKLGASDLFLEVRESNAAAIQLYKKFGFELQSRRAGYYQNPPADALIMRRGLTASDVSG